LARKVLVLSRVRPYIWRVIAGKYDERKRKLKWEKTEIEIPETQDLDVVRPKSKFSYVVFEDKGQLVQILEDQDLAAAGQAPAQGRPKLRPDPLVNPKDLPKDEERRSLVAMLALKLSKSDLLFYILIGIGMGVFMGLFFGNFYHPGYVPAPPPGYVYALQHVNATATTTTTSIPGINLGK
jgi:hypothetical protein